MLYGKDEVKDEIIKRVKEFEQRYDKKVIFGSMVGSISKGVERYDSDYDTRFLYFDKKENSFIRWDKVLQDINEIDIHMCYTPREGLFYDKIAFWELTSFINFLRKPQLDGKFSVGLHHIVGWTFNSPYCWDPYGIKNKINFLLDDMCQVDYEICYYKNYIEKCLNKEEIFMREYLYSCYYAIAIQYCAEYQRFAPIYFPTLLVFCKDKKVREAIEQLQNEYYHTADELLGRDGEEYTRKMANNITVNRNRAIDNFLFETLSKADTWKEKNHLQKKDDGVEQIISIIIDSLQRPLVRGVND